MFKKILLTQCDGNISLELTPLTIPFGKMVYRGTITSSLHEVCAYCNQAICYHSCDQSTYANDEHEESEDDVAARRSFNGAIDGIESLILSLACNGVKVDTDTFQNAVQNALDAVGNNSE